MLFLGKIDITGVCLIQKLRFHRITKTLPTSALVFSISNTEVDEGKGVGEKVQCGCKLGKYE